MNTLLLQYAVEVERAGSISKAAERLYMNQPHLSKAIRELEKTVGISIFRRTAKGVFPTQKGAVFLEYAKSVLEQIEEMENLCRAGEQTKPKFAVAVPRASYISAAFAAFVGQLPLWDAIRIDYQETNPVRIMDGVSDGELNLGIVRCKTAYEGYFIDAMKERELKWRLLWEYRPVLVMSEKHPLASCKITEADLKQYTEISHGDVTIPVLPLGKRQEAKMREERRREIFVYERGSQFELLNAVPTTYMWGSPVPDAALERFSLVQKHCLDAPHDTMKDWLVFHKDYSFSKRDTMFANLLTQYISNMKCKVRD